MVQQLLKKIKDNVQQALTFKLPKQIISPYAVDKEEYRKAIEETAIEREWYAGQKPYSTNEDITEAVKKGILVPIGESPNYLPIFRFRNPDLVDKYPPYLSKQLKQLVDDITSEWRIKMNDQGLPANIRLAISSLVRTDQYQQMLLEEGRFAQHNSPHTFGEAIDIDSAGYYVGDHPMNPRVALKQRFVEGFSQLTTKIDTPEEADLSDHNPGVTKLLKEILEKRADEGQIHFITEFTGTENEIFHICRNPHYNKKFTV